MNKYQKAIHKLVKADVKFDNIFGFSSNESYRTIRIGRKYALKMIGENTIEGANNLKNYILCAFNDSNQRK